MPRAGQFDQRITIYDEEVTGQDSWGQDIVETVVVSNEWAKVQYLTGREFEPVMQKFAEARYHITVRYNPAITIQREQWIEWNGQTIDMIDIQGQGTREKVWVIIAKDHVE